MAASPALRSKYAIPKIKVSGVALPVGYKKGYKYAVSKAKAAISVSPAGMPLTTIKPSYAIKPSPAIKPPFIPSPRLGIGREPKRPLLLVTKAGEKRYKIPVGSIAWKQGLFWKYIPSPWTQEKPITLKYPPVGAKYIGEKTPQKTIQMIGKPKARIPKSVSIDLGVVDIKIDNYGREISFTGHGLKTVAGGSIPGAAKGMSIPAISPVKVGGYQQLAFGTDVRSLIVETYNKKIPKKFAEKVLSQKLGKMTPGKIAQAIKEGKVSSERQTEILKHLPDRVRKQTELWLSIEREYAPTRGVPKAFYQPPHLRRKKKKVKKVISEVELEQSASVLRA